MQSLNPYCSGQWSRTPSFITSKEEAEEVLILIVVEDGLVPKKVIAKYPAIKLS